MRSSVLFKGIVIQCLGHQKRKLYLTGIRTVWVANNNAVILMRAIHSQLILLNSTEKEKYNERIFIVIVLELLLQILLGLFTYNIF